jgi:hypothetical protein
MSLRKRPTITPALLAANRANALRSTGPRTAEGKDRIVLNALKDGRHARDLGEKLGRAKSNGDAELFQWILEQVRTAFRLHGWQEDERKAERLAQQVWCEFGREERRLYTFTRRLGNGRVRFPRRTATLWALPWTPPRLGGLGTNPEYAVKSTDRFLTSLSRIQVEIKNQRIRSSPLHQGFRTERPSASRVWKFAGAARLGVRRLDAAFPRSDRSLAGGGPKVRLCRIRRLHDSASTGEFKAASSRRLREIRQKPSRRRVVMLEVRINRAGAMHNSLSRGAQGGVKPPHSKAGCARKQMKDFRAERPKAISARSSGG